MTADGVDGRVVILNGGSSAGKTTLARALQSTLPEPWLLLGIDLMIWTLPPEMINRPDGLSRSRWSDHSGRSVPDALRRIPEGRWSVGTQWSKCAHRRCDP